MKIAFVDDFIVTVDPTHTQLVAVISPSWTGYDNNRIDFARFFFESRHIPFIDFSSNPKFLHQDKYFYDGSHMNATGASEFTKDIVHLLKQSIVTD